MNIPEVYMLATELAKARGYTDLVHTIKPDEYVDIQFTVGTEEWRLRITPHADNPNGWKPFRWLIERNGWPAAVIDPDGGTVTMSEDQICAILKGQIEEAQGHQR